MEGMEARRSHQKDTGYAWMVLFAGTFAMMLMGIVLCNGAFNIVFLEEFGRSKSMTSWCRGLQIGLLNTAGIIGSFLLIRYGIRMSMLVGALCIFLGFAGCYFAQTFWAVLFFYGVVAGLGFGITYTTAIVSMGHYFDKYRNLAFGIVSCGCGIGLMVFSPLLAFLLQIYDWRGAILILSAILANLFVCAGLMRPVNHTDSEIKRDMAKAKSDKYEKTDIPNPMKNSNEYATYTDDTAQSSVTYSERETVYNEETLCSKTSNLNNLSHNTNKSDEEVEALQAQDSLQYRNAKTSSQFSQIWSRKIINSPLCSIEVVGFLLNLFLQSIGVSAFYNHFPAFILQISAAETMLLTFIGLANVISRPIYGVIANQFSSHLLTIYNVSAAVAGICTLFIPLVCSSAAGQIASALAFAIFGNAYIPLIAPMSVHFVGLEHLDLFYGIACVPCGIGCIVGPVIAGWCWDIGGSYVYSFLFIGGSYLMSSLILLISSKLNQLAKRQTSQN